MSTTNLRALELKVPPLATLALCCAAMLGIERLFPALGFALPARELLAAVSASAGVLVAILGATSFVKAGTTVNPMKPETSSLLVISGVYRWTRNPMYLGMLLVLVGLGFYLSHPLAWLVAAGFVPVMNRLQIVPEERILAARFGTDFESYRARVRRWI